MNFAPISHQHDNNLAYNLLGCRTEQIYRLYYQNPKLSFFFMRLIVERLLRDVKRGAIEPGTV